MRFNFIEQIRFSHLLNALAVVLLFVFLTYLNLFYALDFNWQLFTDNWLEAYRYEIIYVFMITVLIYAGWPFKEVNLRELILLFLLLNFLEYNLLFVVFQGFNDYFYIVMGAGTLLAYLSYKVISNREFISLKIFSLMLNFPLLKGWAQRRLARLYYTKLDSYFSRLFYWTFIAALISDSLVLSYSAYLDVPWYKGSLLAKINEGAFDIYSATDMFANTVLFVLLLWVVVRITMDKAADKAEKSN